MEDKYKPQKKHLESKKQLRVWVDAEKYERFKSIAGIRGESIYAIVQRMIDQYCEDKAGE